MNDVRKSDQQVTLPVTDPKAAAASPAVAVQISESSAKPPSPVVSAQTKAEQEAGRRVLSRFK